MSTTMATPQALPRSQRSLRILMLTDFYPPVIGGLERHAQTLSRELIARGHHVAVVTPSVTGARELECDGELRIHRPTGWVQKLSPLHVNPERRFHPPAPDPGIVAALRKIISSERPDLIHAHGWILHSYLPLRRSLGIPVVATLHDYGLACPKRTYLHEGRQCSGPAPSKCPGCAADQYGRGKALALTTTMLLTRRMHREVDRYIAVSEAVATASRPVSRREAQAIEVIPNFLAASAGDRALETRRPEFLPAEDGYLLFVGALSAHKGIHVLLEAHARMRHRVPLVMIGTTVPGTPKPAARDLVVLTDVPNAEVMAAWARCAVGVVPSIWPEPSATTVFEAMACGRPIVCSDVGGLPEVVEHEVSGLIVPPREPDALSAALDRLIGDPALRRRLGAQARARFGDFTASAVCARIERTYREVLAETTSRVGAGA